MSAETGEAAVFLVQFEPTDRWPPSADELTAHSQFLQGLQEHGTLLLSGPLLDGDGSGHGRAVTVIRAESREDAIRIMADEPLFLAGLRRHTIRRWNITRGVLATSLRSGRATTS